MDKRRCWVLWLPALNIRKTTWVMNYLSTNTKVYSTITYSLLDSEIAATTELIALQGSMWSSPVGYYINAPIDEGSVF